jgi:hypothetical protein
MFQLLASEDARRSLRKAARLGAAGFPQKIDEDTRRRLSPTAVIACRKLGAAGCLEPKEIATLLGMTAPEYEAATEHSERASLNAEQFDRAGVLIEICVTLVQLFVGSMALAWPRHPNNGPLFGSLSAIELMQRGGLVSMREVLGHLQALALGL